MVRDCVTASVLYALHPAALPAVPPEVAKVFTETATAYTEMAKIGVIDLSPEAWPTLNLDYQAREGLLEQTRKALAIRDGLPTSYTLDWKAIDSSFYSKEAGFKFLQNQHLEMRINQMRMIQSRFIRPGV